jgi:hypothetical protein
MVVMHSTKYLSLRSVFLNLQKAGRGFFFGGVGGGSLSRDLRGLQTRGLAGRCVFGEGSYLKCIFCLVSCLVPAVCVLLAFWVESSPHVD